MITHECDFDEMVIISRRYSPKRRVYTTNYRCMVCGLLAYNKKYLRKGELQNVTVRK